MGRSPGRRHFRATGDRRVAGEKRRFRSRLNRDSWSDDPKRSAQTSRPSARPNMLTRHDRRSLYGKPIPLLMRPFSYLADRHRLGPLGRYVWFSRQVPGWTRGQEAIRLAQVSSSLPENAVVVEIGSFLGCSAILLAGGRKTSGSGEVHCVDPFDGSGDAFSVPIYESIRSAMSKSLRQRFEENLSRAGVRAWVHVHSAHADKAVDHWTRPIDMLFLDGNQSTTSHWPHTGPGRGS